MNIVPMTPVDMPPEPAKRPDKVDKRWNWQLSLGLIDGKGWHRIDVNVRQATLSVLARRTPGVQIAMRHGNFYVRYDRPEQ